MEYSFNFVLIVQPTIEHDYVLKQLRQLVQSATESDITQLLQNIPFQENIQLSGATAQITFEVVWLNEQNIQRDLEMRAPSAFIIIIPKEIGLQ
jgi:hypothetical protein